MSEEQLDRKDLKIMAYRERVGELQDQVADLRVDITFLSNQLSEANQKLAEYEQPGEVVEDAETDEA